MLASRTSRWSAGAVLLSVLILVAAWFLMIGPRWSEAAQVRTQATSAQDQAGQLNAQIAQLKAQFGDLPQREAELAAVRRQLPTAADVPVLVRNLQTFASQAGVDLDSVTPGAPVYVTAGATTGTATTGTTGTAAGGSGPAGSVVEVPVTVSVTGEYFEDSLFLKYLQTRLSRAFLIKGLDFTGTGSGTSTTTDGSSAPASTASAAPSAPVSAASSGQGLTVTGAVYVLLDDSTTLAEIKKEAEAAAKAPVVSGARAS